VSTPSDPAQAVRSAVTWPPTPGATKPPQSPARQLRLPGVEQRLRYAAHYWGGTLANLAGPHRLRTAGVGRYAAAVRIGDPLRQAWHAMFDADASLAVPFLCHQGVGTLLYLRLFADLGVNVRHLLPLWHSTRHVVSPAAFAKARRQHLVSRLSGVWQVGGDRALVGLRTAVHRPAGEGGALLAEVDDSFLIRGVPAADLRRLPVDDEWAYELRRLRQRRPLLDPALATAWLLPLAADMGRRFGRIGGDANPVHTSHWAARAFGRERPFLQGPGLRNAVVAGLARHGLPMQNLQITFANPAYLGQTLRVLAYAGCFELVDEGGRVVAFGWAGDHSAWPNE
jgi:hypothetical protein